MLIQIVVTWMKENEEKENFAEKELSLANKQTLQVHLGSLRVAKNLDPILVLRILLLEPLVEKVESLGEGEKVLDVEC